MTCIIVDDEATARMVVEQYCNSREDLDIVATFDNAIEALKFLNQDTVDLVFLDIHMPGFSGMDFVKTLKDPPLVILTTSDREFAIESYEYEHVIDYLVKPVSEERFSKALDKAAKRLSRARPQPGSSEPSIGGNDLYINIDRRLIKLDMDDILVIEAKGDYIHIRCTDKEHRVHTTLKKIKEKLPDDKFLQIHRSYIINFTRIIDIEDNSVLIEKQVIPISRSNRPELMRRLNLL